MKPTFQSLQPLHTPAWGSCGRLAIGLILLLASAVQAAVLPCGVPTDGRLDTPSTVTDFFLTNPTTEVYTFPGEAGERILIRFQNTTTDTGFRPRMQMRAPSASVIQPATPPYIRPGATDAWEYSLGETGEYRFEVQATSVTPGTFRLVLIRLNRPCAAAVLSCGAASGSQVAGRLDVRTYRVDARANDIHSFRFVKTGPFPPSQPIANPPPPPGPTRVAILVYGPDGLLMNQSDERTPAAVQQPFPTENNNRPQDNFIRVDVRAHVSGPITAVVFDQLNNTAAFSISASRLNGGCGDRPLICGTPVDTAIRASAAVDGYVVGVQPGDVLSVRLARAETGGEFQPFGEIYDQAGRLLATVNPVDSIGHTVAVGTTAPAPTGGTYTVLVKAGPDARTTGAYTIALNRLNRPCTTSGLGCSSIVDGRIEGLLRSNVYSFGAGGGDAFLIRLLRTGENPVFRPRVDIYAPDGSQVQTTTTTNDQARVNFTVPATGTYTVVVADNSDGGQTGNYTLSSFRLNRPCTVTPVECGSVLNSSIEGPLRFSAFSYEAQPGDSFAVRLLNAAGIQPGLEVYDPAGQRVGANAPGNVPGVDVVRPGGGPYTLLALDESRNPGQGSFSIGLHRTRNACGTSPPQGESVEGVVGTNGPYVSYSIPVSAGDALNVRSVSYSQGFNALMELYDHEGARIDQGTYAINRRVSTAGTYTVLVSASNPRTAGAYTFSWQLLNNPNNTSPVACGAAVQGAISPGTAFRYYHAALNADDLAKLVLTRTSENFSPQLEIYDPSGARVASTGTETTQRIRGDGNYLLLVTPASATGETGAFAVSLQRLNDPCNAAALACGRSLLRKVDAPGQIDAFTFEGAAGDTTTLRLPVRTGEFAPFGELYNPSATLVRGFNTGTLTIALPAAGRYTLLVRDRNGAGLGSYRASLQTDPPCPVEDSEAPAITLVSPTGGEVITGGTAFRIAWQSDDNVDIASHEIAFSTDGGQTFPTVIAASLSGAAQSHDWTPPADIAPTRNAMIRVTAVDAAGNSQSATSEALAVIGSGFTENSRTTLVYDALNRVTEAAYGDGRTVRYTYDAAGNLVEITVTGQP